MFMFDGDGEMIRYIWLSAHDKLLVDVYVERHLSHNSWLSLFHQVAQHRWNIGNRYMLHPWTIRHKIQIIIV